MPEWALLAPLTREQQRTVLAAGRRRTYARKEIVFHFGDPGDTLHLVESGHVAVQITTPLGELATLAVVGPGETFGELAVLRADQRRTATCVALEQASTWSLHRDQLTRLRAEYPALDRLLIGLLAGYVERLSEHLVQAHYVGADRRVALRLLDLADSFGDNRDIPVTQEDLATLAGTSRATVNRVLGELERDGAVAVSRGRLAVLDQARLARAGGELSGT